MTQETVVRSRLRRRTVQGAQTREAILDGAVHVLSTQGLASFSIPQVAAAVGVAPGNLTYYFPTREDLIRAMSERLLAKYAMQFEQTCARLTTHADADLETLIDWLLDDAVSPATVHMFPELWAMANHNAFVAQSLDHIYDGAVRALIRALGADPGSVESAQLRTCAYLLGCVSEGCTAIFGRAGPADARFIAVKERSRSMLADALRDALHSASE